MKQHRFFTKKERYFCLYLFLLLTICKTPAYAQLEDTLVSQVKMTDGSTKTFIVVNEYSNKLRRGAYTLTIGPNPFRRVGLLVYSSSDIQEIELQYFDVMCLDMQVSYRFSESKAGLIAFGYVGAEADNFEFKSYEYGGAFTYALSTRKAVARRNIVRSRNKDDIQYLAKHPVVLYNIANLQFGYLKYHPAIYSKFRYNTSGPTTGTIILKKWDAHHIFAGINFQRICNVSAHHTSAHPKRIAGATWTKFGRHSSKLDLYFNVLLSIGGENNVIEYPEIKLPKFGAGFKLGASQTLFSRKTAMLMFGIESAVIPIAGNYVQYFGFRVYSIDLLL